MKPSGIGGMAVMEGVMMKNKDEYAVAVRKPNNEIAVEKSTHQDFSDKVKLFKLPVFRGMLAFVDSMLIGVKALNFSASFFDEEEESTKTKNKSKKAKNSQAESASADDDFEVEEVSVTHMEAEVPDLVVEDHQNEEAEKIDKVDKPDKKADTSNALLMVLAVFLSIVMSVTLFMVLPVLLTNLLKNFVENRFLMALIEGIVRLAIFIGYVILASRMPEIKRVFMYHGAEHKTINCLENGFELTVENVKWQSKQHKRCGTSFMLLVILISLVFFMLLPTSNLLWRVLSRVLLVPFIAGVSYEFIRLAGKSDSKFVHILSQPGMWMQGLTTKEPDDAMIEVAIQSVGAVFDWRAFLETSAADEKKTGKSIKEKKQEPKSHHAVTAKQSGTGSDNKKNTSSVSATSVTTAKASSSDEEDDEILKALDKYFDFGTKESNKSSEDN